MRPADTRRVVGSLAVALLALHATALAAPARPIRFDRLSLEQGLSQSTVYQVLQDRTGYVWLATEDGLNRHDGVAFKVYSHDPSDPASLPSSFVWAVAEDGAGNLWAATTSGLAMWERAKDRITRYEPLAGLSLRALHFAAKQNVLWIGTRDSGLIRLDLASGATTRFVNDPADPSSLNDNRIYAIRGDSQGRLWVGTDGGLGLLDAQGKGFVRFVPSADSKSLSDLGVRAIEEDASGAVWVGTTKGGLNRLDPASGTFERFRHDVDRPASLAHDRVLAVLVDSERRVWAGTIEGLDLFDPEHRSFVHYRHDPSNPTSLASDHILALTQDRSGVIWVGTKLGGAHKWKPLSWQFGHVAPDHDSPTGLGSGNVTSFSEDHGGRLWVGTFDAGLYAMERTSGEMKPFRHDPKNPGTLGSDKVMSLLHDRRGDLWIGTFDAGLDRFSPATGVFKHYRSDSRRSEGLSASGVTAILEDRGRLWLGTYGGGLERFDPETERFTHYRNDPKDVASLSGDRVSSLALSPSGALWVGTMEKGLNLLDPASGRFRRYGHKPGDPGSLPSDSIFTLFVEPAGGLWVGARGGLSYLAPEAQAFRTYTTKQGLPSDHIYGIRGDRQGRLWISTNKGISSLDPRSGAFTHYGVSDGVQSAEFNFGAWYQNSSGELFFGGINGFNAFVPERVRQGTQAPAVVLTSVTVGRQSVAGPADQVRRVHLGYRDYVLGFDFAALDFAAPERNQFAYKLEGLDPDFIPLSGRRSVTYTNLRPGQYTFRLRAANSDGRWNEEGLSVAVDVAAAPWLTGWAFAIYAALLAAGILAIVRVQRRKFEREAEYARTLELRVQERTQQLSARQAELERANYDLAQASITDSLTGLANRRFLIEYLEREVPLLHRRYRRLEEGTLGPDQIDMAFVMVDLDRFKEVNDSAGHAAGDAVLKQLKDLLKAVSRNSDIIVRWGGDEFLVVARDQTGDGLIEFAERIRTSVAQHAFEVGEGRVVRTTCSIGFARYPFIRQQIEALTWEQVISVADRALYVAKASGRDAWVGLHPGVSSLPGEGMFGAICHKTQQLVREGALRVSSSLTGIRRLVWEPPEPDEVNAPAAGGETGGAEIIRMRPNNRGSNSH
jgi:diguanylate cyclase (GGDEF)-like protein